MIPNLYISNSQGEILIEKQWTPSSNRYLCDFFWAAISKYPQLTEVPPFISSSKHIYVNIFRSNLFFLTVLNEDVMPLYIIDIQTTIFEILLHYFDDEINEPLIRDNFFIVYQLLDQIIDGGHPLVTEINQLKELIATPTVISKVVTAVTGKGSLSNNLPHGLISSTPWRKSNVKYVNNEIYFDQIETLDVIIGSNEQIITSVVSGQIICNCKLSGFPDISMSFNRPSIMNECQLHRCIRLIRFEREHILSFVPPDGKSVIMSYRVNNIHQLPLYIKPLFSVSGSNVHFSITVGPKYNENKPIDHLVISFPLPQDSGNKQFSITHGNFIFDEISKILTWDIDRMPPDKTISLDCDYSLHDNIQTNNMGLSFMRPIINVEFLIKMYSASGLAVDNVTIHNIKYKPFKGVRFMTKSGRFNIRC